MRYAGFRERGDVWKYRTACLRGNRQRAEITRGSMQE